jgi:hypothetical protein
MRFPRRHLKETGHTSLPTVLLEIDDPPDRWVPYSAAYADENVLSQFFAFSPLAVLKASRFFSIPTECSRINRLLQSSRMAHLERQKLHLLKAIFWEERSLGVHLKRVGLKSVYPNSLLSSFWTDSRFGSLYLALLKALRETDLLTRQ